MLQKTAWTVGDAPEMHPAWEREVERELEMREAGRERFVEATAKAASKGRMTTVAPVRGLMVEWLPLMVHGIREWLRDTRTAAARRDGQRGGATAPISAQLLRTIDPNLAAYVTLRTVLDCIGREKLSVMTVAKDIGSALEHEARMTAWEKRDPALFHKVQRGFSGGEDRAPATPVHRRRVNINRFNALMREPLAWKDWREDERTRLGLDLLDILIRYTKRFQMIPDPNHIGRRGRKVDPQYVLVPTEDFIEWLTAKLDKFEVMAPMFQPTVIPPKRWQGVRGGGYHTPHLRTPSLVRFKAHQENQRGNAEQEYDSFDMPTVYEALHVLQETGWRVNTKVLSVASYLWDHNLALAGLPSRDPLFQEPPIEGETEEEVRFRKRRNADEHSRFVKRCSHIKAADTTLRVAQSYAEEEVFYFPHMLDFRGRLYPIPNGLQPQGDDLARGLLEFHEGKPITEDNGGDGWLAIHLANTFGKDKVSNDDRIAWVQDREDLWRAIAADPIENRQWCEKGVDHFQALAAVFEWVRFLDEGYGMVSHLPIRVDGTCNGIQHLSALVRDEIGGAAVNLSPAEAPRDIYQEVAGPLTSVLEGIAEAGGEDGTKAAWWLQFRNEAGVLPRSLTKRPVMIVPYGGSREAHFTYTRQWLNEEHPAVVKDALAQERAGIVPHGTLGRHVAFLVKHLADQIDGVVERGVEVMEWLQKCAKHAAQGNQPIYWETPSGFVVRHFYGKMRVRRLKTKLDGRSIQVTDNVPTKELDTREQLKGIAPNFIHSLDASALMSAVTLAADNGVTSVTTIHDAYGTHAADMWVLFKALRRAFVRTHEVDVLGEFRKACLGVLATHIIVSEGLPEDMEWAAYAKADSLLPPPLPHGTLDLSQVEESDYFFS